MKQLIIPFVASFGLSLGLAAGVVVVRTPKPPAVQAVVKAAGVPQKPDSARVIKDTATVVDSAGTAASGQAASANVGVAVTAGEPAVTAGNGGNGETAVPAVGRGAAAGQPASNSKQPVPTASLTANAKSGSNPSANPSANPGATPKPILLTPKPASDSLIGRRLAQVFGAMQAKDAARVLEQMDDNDVRAILGSLSSKQQAAILGSFPTQRAALILQATLRTASSGGAE